MCVYVSVVFAGCGELSKVKNEHVILVRASPRAHLPRNTPASRGWYRFRVYRVYRV